MDGKNTGYCGSIIGTEVYRDSRSKLKDMLEGNKCHTFDRFNWLSKLDTCANKKQSTLLKEAIEMNFKVEHWPYMHLN